MKKYYLIATGIRLTYEGRKYNYGDIIVSIELDLTEKQIKDVNELLDLLGCSLCNDNEMEVFK